MCIHSIVSCEIRRFTYKELTYIYASIYVKTKKRLRVYKRCSNALSLYPSKTTFHPLLSSSQERPAAASKITLRPSHVFPFLYLYTCLYILRLKKYANVKKKNFRSYVKN